MKTAVSISAIASLVLGILAPLTLALTSLPAIVLGHVARSQIRHSGGRLGGQGLATTGLTLGYLSGGLVLIGLAWLTSQLLPPSDEVGTVSQDKVNRFASRAGLLLPSSAKAIEYRWYFAMDGAEALKLEIPGVDLEAFLEDSALADELTNTTRTSNLTRIYRDLSLQAPPEKFREGQKSLPRGEALNVLVDLDDPEKAVIYLCWFGT